MEKPREENGHYISENEVVSKPKLVFVTDEKEKGNELMNTYREVRKMFDERDKQADRDRIAQEMKEKSLKNRIKKLSLKSKPPKQQTQTVEIHPFPPPNNLPPK